MNKLITILLLSVSTLLACDVASESKEVLTRENQFGINADVKAYLYFNKQHRLTYTLTEDNSYGETLYNVRHAGNTSIEATFDDLCSAKEYVTDKLQKFVVPPIGSAVFTNVAGTQFRPCVLADTDEECESYDTPVLSKTEEKKNLGSVPPAQTGDTNSRSNRSYPTFSLDGTSYNYLHASPDGMRWMYGDMFLENSAEGALFTDFPHFSPCESATKTLEYAPHVSPVK